MPWIFNHWKQMNGEVLRVFDMQRTGAFIAMCRREQGFTQNELAQRMGVSFQAVSNWERGTAMPDISKLEELSNLLQITPEELLRGRRTEPVQGEHDADTVAANVQPEDQAAEPQQKTERENAQPKPADEAGEPEAGAGDGMDLQQLVSLAPFVSTEVLDQAVNRALSAGTPLTQLHALLPFISTELVDAYAARAVHGPEDFRHISSLAPFMSKQALTQLVERYVHSAQALQYLTPLAPFLDQNWLDVFFKNSLSL